MGGYSCALYLINPRLTKRHMLFVSDFLILFTIFVMLFHYFKDVFEPLAFRYIRELVALYLRVVLCESCIEESGTIDFLWQSLPMPVVFSPNHFNYIPHTLNLVHF